MAIPDDRPAPPDHGTWLADPLARLPAPCPPAQRSNLRADALTVAPDWRHDGGGGLLSDAMTRMEAVAGGLTRQAHLVDLAPGSMPAGYTYLAQLLAHDIASPTGANPVAVAGSTRSESAGVMLDSLFGPLFDARPLPEVFRFKGGADRMISADLHRPGDVAQVWDPRNDDSPMLAQLSALFLLYARRAERRLRGQFSPAAARRLARCLTVEVFHRVLRADLLPHLLLPSVASFYASPAATPHLAPDRLIPVEFTNAAFRFGHAMVRPVYTLNPHSPAVPVAGLIAGQAGLEGIRKTSNNFWRLDWRHFFGPGPNVQLARRLGPGVSPHLVPRHQAGTPHSITPDIENRRDGLAHRDLGSSVNGGLLRVDRLIGLLAPVFAALPGANGWAVAGTVGRASMVRDWASQTASSLPDHLIKDPPLYLMVMIESGPGDPARGFGDGRTLGALGSIIVAETVLPAIARAEETIAQMPDMAQARTIARAGLEPPDSMWALVQDLTDTP